MELQELIEKIEEKYTSDDIINMLDDEILNWDYGYSESEIEEEHDSRWDFYYEFNNGEAENAIVDNILTSIELSRNKLFDLGLLEEFEEWLSDYVGCNFNK